MCIVENVYCDDFINAEQVQNHLAQSGLSLDESNNRPPDSWSMQAHYGVFTLSEGFDDESEVEEADEEHIEFLEPREDSAEALEASEQPFDFVAPPVEGAIILPRFDAVGLGRNHGNHAQIEHQLPRLIALIGPIHQHRQAFRYLRQCPQRLASFGASCAFPGDRAKAMAVRAFAATR